jgi:serine/threonine protein kinase
MTLMSTCPSCTLPLSDVVPYCVECGFSATENADRDPWCDRLISGRFRLVSKLGAGGMGAVYEAIQDPIGRTVALKVLSEELAENPGQVERFKREAQAASQLSHPNTIVVHDFGQDEDGTLFIAMEHLQGQSLDERIKDHPPPGPAWVVKILNQVCDSLQEAHDAGLVHRDLKPENIFLTRRSTDPDLVKVLDFGIAKVTHSPTGDTMERLTQQGTICGTPHYMAPEQIRDLPVDHRADIYALGVLLYWLIAGREPFNAGKVVDLLTKHIKEKPPSIEIPAGPEQETWRRLESIALHALEKSPDDRPQDAKALRQALTSALGNNVVMSSTGGVTTITAPPTRRLRARVVWGLVALIGAAAALVWGLNLFTAEDKAPVAILSTEPTNAERMAALFWADGLMDEIDAGHAPDPETPSTSTPQGAPGFWQLDLLSGVKTPPQSASSKPTSSPITKKFGEVRLDITPSHASVRIGTVPVPWNPIDRTVRLAVGQYVFDISADGRSTQRRVQIRAGEISIETVQLGAPP